MAGGVNKVILVGNLGKDPEIRHLESGATVANFTMATTETYKDRNSGERKSLTEWHNIVLWRGLAEVAAKYLKKGNQVYIEGKIKTRSWEDQDGNTRYTTEIVGDNMTMLGTKNDNAEYQNYNSAPSGNGNIAKESSIEKENPQDTESETDDLPF